MIGIYKYTNIINNKVYIGQSVNIEKRERDHFYAHKNINARDYNSKFHQALRKYGYENFKFEVLTVIDKDAMTGKLLDELEIYYINLYNSYKMGYNATIGGSNFSSNGFKGEKNGRAKLKEDDIKYIRECYNAKIPFRVVYDKYCNKISKRGLQKIWYFENWKDIYPEYNTKENKYYHSHLAKANPSEVASNNKRFFSNEEVKNFRKEYKNGKTPMEIKKKYNIKTRYSTLYNMLTGKTYKEII